MDNPEIQATFGTNYRTNSNKETTKNTHHTNKII